LRKYGCVKICRTFTRACSQVNELVTGAISEAIAAEKKGALQSKKDDISIGQRVKARFSDGEWYKGTVDDIDLAATDWETTRVHIRFDDGDESWSDFPSESLRIEEQQPEQKQQLKTRAEAGDQQAMYILGRMLLEKSSKPLQAAEAEAWLLKAVDAGNVLAGVALGQAYYNGDGGLDEQPGKAEEYWMQASDQGNAEAQNLLGCYYFFEKVTNRQRTQQPATTTAVAQ
jgi:hypothetical protein